MLNKRVCIVGAGLMGGSMALALRPFTPHLTLVDTDPAALSAAADFVDCTTAVFAEGVAEADLIIFAVPVRVIVRLLKQLPQLKPEGCMVMDMGSTKKEICREMDDLPSVFEAIGGHPMCGKAEHGFAAADPDLYRGETFILCRTSHATPRMEKTAVQLLTQIAAAPLFLTPDDHDRITAVVSHLPYVAAAALMQTAAANAGDLTWQVSASGFRDTSRVAGTDPRMMLDILLTNKTAVLRQIERYMGELTAVGRLLQTEDEAGLKEWLEETQRAHGAYKTATQERSIASTKS